MLGERALGLVRELLAGVAGVSELAQMMRLARVRLGVGTMRSTSSSVRPEPPSIRICCSLPRSFADTLMIPLASMSNDTSIWGIPRIAGGIPTSWNFRASC